jgi:hypothetical protein
MGLWHITIGSVRRLTMFPSEQLLRAAVVRLVAVTGRCLLLFCIVDDHVHVVVWVDEQQVGRIGAALLCALRPIARAELERPHRVPVKSRDHLEWLVRYLLDQPRKHSLAVIPARYSGSCFADLIGARVVPGFEARIYRLLPRLRPARVCALVGLPASSLVVASDERLRSSGVARIAEAAAAALAVGPELVGSSPGVVTARQATVHLVDRAPLSRADLPRILGVSPRTVRRLAGEAVAPEVLRAVRLQLTLDDATRATRQVPRAG